MGLPAVSSQLEPSAPAVLCRGLRKRYPGVVAVDGLDLSIERGECFGLLGPNGAGKTTTIEILEGLIPRDEGEVEVLGMRWENDERLLRERIGISLQETRLNDKLTVFETLRLFRSFFRRGREPRQLLEQLSLVEKSQARVGNLSGGQKQRLAVACALIGEPELLFLDEPTTGLDPQSRLELWKQVTRFREQGGTVLLTTHYMDEAERLCDRVAVVDHGKVIALGTPQQLISMLHGSSVIEISTEPRITESDLRMIPGVQDVLPRDPHWALTVDSLVSTVPALLSVIERSGARLIHLSTHRATLEDVFVSLTGRELREE